MTIRCSRHCCLRCLANIQKPGLNQNALQINSHGLLYVSDMNDSTTAHTFTCTFTVPPWHLMTVRPAASAANAATCFASHVAQSAGMHPMITITPSTNVQRETLKSKTGILAIIDELEKITPLLKEAAAEEVSKGIAAADAKAAARAERRAERERAEQDKAAAETADANHKANSLCMKAFCPLGSSRLLPRLRCLPTAGGRQGASMTEYLHDGCLQEEGPSTPPQEGAQEAEQSTPAADATASPGQASEGIDRLLSLLYFSQVLLSSDTSWWSCRRIQADIQAEIHAYLQTSVLSMLLCLRSCSAGRRSMCSRRSAPPACPTTSTQTRCGSPRCHMIMP